MYVQNLTENHVSLFNGGLVVKRGAISLISKADADSRELADAVRRGWVKLIEDPAQAASVKLEERIAPEDQLTDPAKIGTMDAADVMAAAADSAAPAKRARKSKTETTDEAAPSEAKE